MLSTQPERQTGGNTPLVSARGLVKVFDGAAALRGVDLDIYPGEVHGLVGANGAGKSTFIRMLAGAVQPDRGELSVGNEPVTVRDPKHARSLGFTFLHQELSLVPKFTVLENMAVGLVSSRWGFADFRSTRARAERLAGDLEFDFSLTDRVTELSVAQQWLVALGRSLMEEARLIAFDEPTGSLSAEEAVRLFAIIARLTDAGAAVLYVSHRLDEVERLCSRVTAFRDGGVVAKLEGAQITQAALADAITGTEAAARPAVQREGRGGKLLLEARDLVREPMVKGVSLRVYAGEIVGLAGLGGSGRSEVARLLMGADRAASGSILWEGALLRRHSPFRASRLGFGFVPEERRSQGLFLNKSAGFNINVATAASLRGRLGLMSTSKASRRASEIAERVQLRPRRTDIEARKLSGGNQQKLVLGRWLVGRRRLLILDEPTRGIDIGTRMQIHRLQRQLADDGMGVLLIDSDFRELLQCDRVVVMREGKIVAELTASELTEQRLLRESYGVVSMPTESAAKHETKEKR